MLLQGQAISISYFSLDPLYVKSPPQRITSHHVYTCVITLGHIPAGHSYVKTNLSPFSIPSLQFAALPSKAVNSNCQSSVTHFRIFYYLRLLQMIIIPPHGVITDVFYVFVIIVTVANYMIRKPFLPYRMPDLFRHISLHLFDHTVCGRGDHRSSAIIGMDRQQNMDMIGHNYVMINGY